HPRSHLERLHLGGYAIGLVTSQRPSLRRSAMFIVRGVEITSLAPEERHLITRRCRSSGAKDIIHCASINIALLRSEETCGETNSVRSQETPMRRANTDSSRSPVASG